MSYEISSGEIAGGISLSGGTGASIAVGTYDFLIDGELLSVRKDFSDGAVFDTITLNVEQLNSFVWTNAGEGVSITVNGIALENGSCDFAVTEISETEKIRVRIEEGGVTRGFTVNTLNSRLPPITAEGVSQTPGDFFLGFINTRSIVKTDNAGRILYYRNEDSPETKYGLWDFKAHQLDGKTYYSYHSADSDPVGVVYTGHNPGERVLMDENYDAVARIRAIATEGNCGDTSLDGHEFLLLGEDHYIVVSYLQLEADNIPDVNIYTGDPIEHADKAVLIAAYLQEIDHGEVVFDWLSTEHPELYSMTVAADFTNTDPGTCVDYVHLNAVAVDDDGNLVLSCRHLNAMIKIDRNGGTGDLIWVLSGVADQFGLTDEQKTSGQHYLRYLGNGSFSVFDNDVKTEPTKLFLYRLDEDETSLAAREGFRSWIVPGTTEFAPGLPCPPHDTTACGSFQLFGEYGVAGWGWNISGDELVTEFRLDDPSDILFQLRTGYDAEGAFASYRSVKALSAAPELTITQQAVHWSRIENSPGYVLSVEREGEETVLKVGCSGAACDIFNLPNGEYVAKVTEIDFGVSSAKSTLKVDDNLSPAAAVSTENGIDDLFFAKSGGTWDSPYHARHSGSLNGGWSGTGEMVALAGKNRLSDIFSGSNDDNLLLLTDDANGDALFVDDIFTGLPENTPDQQARLAQIGEIRAGAGDDIVDLTSQRFEYSRGVTVYGGGGDDTIWANTGGNTLVGDAGNDRLVGASGDDVFAGGSGNDSMHGGGGDDLFVFGGDWGNDTVEQLVSGTVTLWFESGGGECWDPDTLTCTAGANSVTVSGVTADKVTLKFGEDDDPGRFAVLSELGAFSGSATGRIFEERSQGILAI